jgi:hypothetical protein
LNGVGLRKRSTESLDKTDKLAET